MQVHKSIFSNEFIKTPQIIVESFLVDSLSKKFARKIASMRCKLQDV